MALTVRLEPSMTTTLAEILPAAAARYVGRTALIDDRQLSFRELDAPSMQIANGPVVIGVQPGDRVSLFGAEARTI
jgi:long-chain acyl-CoA synthetase